MSSSDEQIVLRQLTVRRSMYPELFNELKDLPPKNRAERLRVLAYFGAMAMQRGEAPVATGQIVEKQNANEKSQEKQSSSGFKADQDNDGLNSQTQDSSYQDSMNEPESTYRPVKSVRESSPKDSDEDLESMRESLRKKQPFAKKK